MSGDRDCDRYSKIHNRSSIATMATYPGTSNDISVAGVYNVQVGDHSSLSSFENASQLRRTRREYRRQAYYDATPKNPRRRSASIVVTTLMLLFVLAQTDAFFSPVAPASRKTRRLFLQEPTKGWVIVVDDEEAIRNAVSDLLTDSGYQITTCADAPTALKVAQSHRVDPGSGDEKSTPDCIVSDIRMPGMDGLELLRSIRSDKVLSEIPVVLLTAKGMTNDRIKGYDAGADAYLPKPFDPDELVAVVDNVIERHVTLSGSDVQVDDLKRDLDEIKFLLLEKGGGGVGLGFVEDTNVFLAPDEREVLELLCQGLTTKEIAEKTFLSSRRVGKQTICSYGTVIVLSCSP